MFCCSSLSQAKCLSNDDEERCRYPAGDAWCLEHGDGNRYAYHDRCLENYTSPAGRSTEGGSGGITRSDIARLLQIDKTLFFDGEQIDNIELLPGVGLLSMAGQSLPIYQQIRVSLRPSDARRLGIENSLVVIKVEDIVTTKVKTKTDLGIIRTSDTKEFSDQQENSLTLSRQNSWVAAIKSRHYVFGGSSVDLGIMKQRGEITDIANEVNIVGVDVR